MPESYLIRAVKKVGQAHFSILRRSEKLAASIARLNCGQKAKSGAGCAGPSSQRSDLVEDRLGDRLLGRDRDLALPVAVDQGDRVVGALEPDRRVGDVVEDDQ